MHSHDCREGKNGWFFLGNDHQFEYDQLAGRFSHPTEFMREWVETVCLINKYCKRRGIIFELVIAPAKGAVYPELFPEDISSRQSYCSRLIQEIRRNNYDVLDLRGPLIEARTIADTYSRLNTHWTDFGGWIAWQAIAQHLSSMDGSFKTYKESPLIGVRTTDAENEMENLCQAKGVNNWTVPDFGIAFGDVEFISRSGVAENKTGRTQVTFYNMPVDVIQPEGINDKNCLVVCDSSMCAISPYINQHFSFISYRNNHVYPENRRSDVADMLERSEADILIYIVAERYGCLNFNEYDHWLAIDSYESYDCRRRYAWPARPNACAIVCQGGRDLDTPNLIQLPSIPIALDDNLYIVVKLTVFSPGPGLVMSSYQKDGLPRQKWHKVEAGENHLFVRLTPPADAGHFWVVRDTAKAPCFLGAIDLRILKAI